MLVTFLNRTVLNWGGSGDGLGSDLDLAFTEVTYQPKLVGRAMRIAHHSTSQLNAITLATERDLQDIIHLRSAYPDTAGDAQSKGFLRERFTSEEYLQLIADGCIRVLRVNGRVSGFVTICPWDHKLLSSERAVTKLTLGPITIRLCNWTNENYSQVVDEGKIIYIAEAAVDPRVSYAGRYLLSQLQVLQEEYPHNHIVTTCSEAPLANLRSSQLLIRLGFERIGFVWLPFRPVKGGGHWRILAPFQSGIWGLKPLHSVPE